MNFDLSKDDTLEAAVLKICKGLDIGEDIGILDVPDYVAEEIREDLRDELRNECDIYDELVEDALEPFSDLEDRLSDLTSELEQAARDAQAMLDAVRGY